ncbi:MAG: hypothetical protein HQL26_04910 [Candidatus Omnitrophica bacterium]|nr:hypothetical protein [Candidatus Omnitrophota bacterium]
MKKNMTLQAMAMCALRKAVRGVILQHQKTGRPLSIWRDGKVVRVSADDVLLGNRR